MRCGAGRGAGPEARPRSGQGRRMTLENRVSSRAQARGQQLARYKRCARLLAADPKQTPCSVAFHEPAADQLKKTCPLPPSSKSAPF